MGEALQASALFVIDLWVSHRGPPDQSTSTAPHGRQTVNPLACNALESVVSSRWRGNGRNVALVRHTVYGTGSEHILQSDPPSVAAGATLRRTALRLGVAVVENG